MNLTQIGDVADNDGGGIIGYIMNIYFGFHEWIYADLDTWPVNVYMVLQSSYKDDGHGDSGKPPVPKPMILYGYALVGSFVKSTVAQFYLSDLEDFGNYLLNGCARMSIWDINAVRAGTAVMV